MRPAPRSNETGIALITTLLVLMMVSALMVGFFATITADQRARAASIATRRRRTRPRTRAWRK